MKPMMTSNLTNKEIIAKTMAESIPALKKLKIVWQHLTVATKEKIKEASPDIYYCILEILDGSIINHLTPEQIEEVYRNQQIESRKDDIKFHAEDLWDNNDISAQDENIIIENREELAKRFIFKYHDCDLPENLVIDQMIIDYLNDYHKNKEDKNE